MSLHKLSMDAAKIVTVTKISALVWLKNESLKNLFSVEMI